jgi:hypothetical protein
MWGGGNRLEPDRGRFLLRLKLVNVIQTHGKSGSCVKRVAEPLLRMIVTNYSHETQMKQWCGHDYEIGTA